MTARQLRVVVTIGFLVGMGSLAIARWAATQTPCDSPFWKGYRIAWGTTVCR